MTAATQIQPLALRLRPQSFADFIGNEITITAITKALDNQRLSHAYLFTGTRGIGKTTLARLVAKAISCAQGVSSKPCNTCDNCIAIVQGNYIDLLEVDAASKTKVEDTRELLDQVQYAPQIGKYKIILIDEVHMLSNHSFNALLKTLEEPPAHCIFILATTDPQKIPATIKSRTLSYHLGNLAQPIIENNLRQVLANEEIQHEDEVPGLVANAAHGSMRDALSILDQCIAMADPVLTSGDVAKLLGITSNNMIVDLMNMVHNSAADKISATIDDLEIQGKNFTKLLTDLIHLTAELITLSATKKTSANPDIAKLQSEVTVASLHLYYQILQSGHRELDYAPTPALGCKITLFKITSFRINQNLSVTPTTASASTPTAPHQAPTPPPSTPTAKNPRSPASDTIQPNTTSQNQQPIQQASPQPTSPTNSQSTTPHNISKLNGENWPQACKNLSLTGMTKALIANAKFQSYQNNTLILSTPQNGAILAQPNHQQRIVEAVNSMFPNNNIKVEIAINSTNQNKSMNEHKKSAQMTWEQEQAEKTRSSSAFQKLNQELNNQASITKVAKPDSKE